MATITFQGIPIHTIGSFPAIGTEAPNFTATKFDLTEFSLKDYLGKKIIINIFPSLDTPTCASAMLHFNAIAEQAPNTVILCISADLPFAQKRFCAAEKLANVVAGSVFRHPEFGKNYGVTIVDGPLVGLLSRAVVVLDENGKVIYTQQIDEITQEPDYNAAIELLNH